MKKIPLSQGKYAIVDDEDFEYLNQWKWYYNKGYACRNVNKGLINGTKKIIVEAMHRRILGIQDSREIDHIDCDKLNNQRSNLRYCSSQENKWNRPRFKNNTSGYKGVFWHKRVNKFMAAICINYKLKHIGYFDTAEEAAIAYKKEAEKNHGDFFRLE